MIKNTPGGPRLSTESHMRSSAEAYLRGSTDVSFLGVKEISVFGGDRSHPLSMSSKQEYLGGQRLYNPLCIT